MTTGPGRNLRLSSWSIRKKKRRKGRGCTREQFEFMRLWYGYRCLKCGERKPLTADHVDSVKDGGRNHISNMQPLCRSCNSSKGAAFVDYRPLAVHVRMMEAMFERGILRSY